MKKYILGLVTGLILIPISEQFMDIIFSWIEVMKIKPSKIILKSNSELRDLQSQCSDGDTSCIGFQYDGPEEECEE